MSAEDPTAGGKGTSGNRDHDVVLEREAELLRAEVAHLRARLAAAEAESARPAAQRGGPEQAGRRAREDLLWLLRRLESSPARPLLRRRAGYRRLLRTYLPTDGA
ncbi:hypothetical protein [Nocardioides litoris]|uniref:hypothetical protein n=1 Tax=Nocardioides litoris TaxID=1926648 RepID=UPI00111E2F6F|nr:hypothetical protein [Nocardioides litoris]